MPWWSLLTDHGWNLTQLPPEIRERFERIQEVELESAPDGPYQYLCGRIDPIGGSLNGWISSTFAASPNVPCSTMTVKTLSPSSALKNKKRCGHRGTLSSWDHAQHRSPLNFTVNTGMVSRVSYDETGKIRAHEVVDKFGHPIKYLMENSLPRHRTLPGHPGERADWGSDASHFLKEQLSRWDLMNSKRFWKGSAVTFQQLRPLRSWRGSTTICPAGKRERKDRGALLHSSMNTSTCCWTGSTGAAMDGSRDLGDGGQTCKSQRMLNRLWWWMHEGSCLRGSTLFDTELFSWIIPIGWFGEGSSFIGRRAARDRYGDRLGIYSGHNARRLWESGEYCGAFNMGALVRVHNHPRTSLGWSCIRNPGNPW